MIKVPSALEQIPADHLELIGCTLCGETASKKLFSVRRFPVVRCDGCGMRYVSPRLKTSQLLDLYAQQDYFKSDNSLVHGYHDYQAERKNILATCHRRMNWILSASPETSTGRLLDIGCALGFSVEYALQQGWDAFGLEPSSYAAQQVDPTLRTRIIHGTLEAHPFQKASFQMILLWDVIEHLPDPLQTLRQMHALLAPGGVVSVITPDCGSGVAKILGRRWMEYAKPTEHIYFFSRTTLKAAGARGGFETIAETTAGKQVSLDILVERLRAHLPVFSFLKTHPVRGWLAASFYIDLKDKMHLLMRKA